MLDRRKQLSVVHLQPRVAPPLQNTLSHPWLGFLILCVGISHQLEVHSNTTGSCESACRKASSNPAAVGAIAEARPHFFGSRAIPSFQAGTKWLKHVLRRLSCSACNRRRMETLIILFKLEPKPASPRIFSHELTEYADSEYGTLHVSHVRGQRHELYDRTIHPQRALTGVGSHYEVCLSSREKVTKIKIKTGATTTN